MASSDGKAPLAIQLAMASWLAPVLASFASTFTRQAGQREPIVSVITGLALMGAVLLGLVCGVAGLAAASRDPDRRRTLLRHSVSGLLVSGLFAILMLGGLVHTISERRANQSAMRRFLELPKTPNLAILDQERRYVLIAEELRRAADTSRGDQKALFELFADGAESLVDPMKQYDAAWKAFGDAGGVDAATMTGSADEIRDRREQLAKVVELTRRYVDLLGNVRTSWTLANFSPKLLPSADRELFVRSLVSQFQDVAMNDISIAAEMDGVLSLLETTYGRWKIVEGELDFSVASEGAEYAERFSQRDALFSEKAPAQQE